MKVFRQEKKDFGRFIAKLQEANEVIAPVKQDVVRFLPITSAADIHLEKNAFFPAKEYFFRKEEVLFTFDGKKFSAPPLEPKPRVFFGLRRCDLNAIRHQDMVFLGQVHDPYYSAQREQSILIGYHCNTAPSPYCFCGSLELAEFHDLMFWDKGSYFLVEIGSGKGKELLEKHKMLFAPTETAITPKERVIPGADRLEKKDISRFYGHPDWKKGVDICLSCSACTALCPTCYCFSIHDEPSTADTTEGERKRIWSSCQVEDFTRVTGNHVFRKKREERFKHRIYHQLEYFKEKNGVNLCVGCGRCIEACPTRIDFVQILNEMK